MISKQTKINFAILLISLLFSLYLVEAFLYFNGNPRDYRTPHLIAAQKAGLPFDRRTPLQIMIDTRAAGNTAYPYISPTLFMTDMPAFNGTPTYAFSNISHMDTIYCNEGGTHMRYQSDRYGFHNPDPLWDIPTLHIVALGDSFVHGACVASDQNAIALLRHTYPHTLNLGASGNGPLSLLGTLREYGQSKQPPIVLWFYFEGNDLGDLLTEYDNPILRQYLEPNFSQNLPAIQPLIDQHRQQVIDTRLAGHQASRHQEAWAGLRLYNVRKLLNLTREEITDIPPITEPTPTTAPPTDPITTTALPLFQQTLQNSQALVHSWGGELIFVYLPSYQRLADPTANDNTLYRAPVLSLVHTLNIPLIDLQPTFTNYPDPLPLSLFPLRLDGHYTPEGYALVAQAIQQSLENNKP